VVNELLMYGGPAMISMLHRYCSLMWYLEQVHHVPGTIISLPKTGDLSDNSKYRGITLPAQRFLQALHQCLELEAHQVCRRATA
jgi:hypothetical protein